jgi:hypothetical protein
MMESGADWAIQALDCLELDKALTPANRLQLAYRYNIQQWILPAVSSLIDRQESRKRLRLITNGDIDQMGWRTYIIISKAVETVQAARTAVAITPPTVHHSPQCRLRQKEQDCNRAWAHFWHTTILRILLAAENPMSLACLPTFLQQENIKDFQDTCKTLTLFHFNSTEVLKVEVLVKEQVSSKIWELYQNGLM